MRAIITVVGHDTVGILSKVSTECAENNVNVMEVTQSILSDLFCMIMLVDVTNLKKPFGEFSDLLGELGEKENLNIRIMREDLFNSMHRI
ncbi:MAG: ACT domain-containing protein [Clostridia bacterium]|nr:ACT domain-containing protein [Clostridia bacterium]